MPTPAPGNAPAPGTAPPTDSPPDEWARGSPGGLASVVGVGYLRRSTDRQEQSIGDQRVAVERFARERGIRLLRHYIDDGISGTSTAGRRAFQDLIADAERLARLRRSRAVDELTDAFTVVVCYDVKRFGRVDNDEAGYYRHILKRCGVEVLYASEGFTGGGVDDLLRPVKQWQARQESKDLAKVVIRGLVSKATNPRESDERDAIRVRRGDGEDGATASCKSGDPGAGGGGTSGGGGWWMGGAPPYGYDLGYESAAGRFIFTVRFERDGTKTLLGEGGEAVRELAKGESVAVSKRDRCRLVLGDPARVDVVKRVFRLYVEERKGFKAIAAALNASGAPTARCREWAPHYSGRWSMTSVRAMLLNPAYCGDLAWNRRTDARFYRIAGGRAVEREASSGFGVQSPARRLEDNDESDWIVARDAHAPIVTRRLWEAAREMLGSDRGAPGALGALGAGLRVASPAASAPGGGGARRPWAGERTKFLLAGLVRCGRCGNSYEGRIDRPGKPNAEGQRSKSYAYVCGGYIRLGRSVCSRGLAPRDEIEALVIERVLEFHRPFMGGREGKRRLERVMLDSMGAEVSETRAARDRARARLGEIAAQAGRLLDSLSEDNRVFVDERLRALGKERKELESRVEALDRLALSDRELGETIREEHLFIQGLEAALRSDRPEDARNALERCVESVTIEAGNPLAIRVGFSRIRGRG